MIGKSTIVIVVVSHVLDPEGDSIDTDTLYLFEASGSNISQVLGSITSVRSTITEFL